jgi:hypothetical protein
LTRRLSRSRITAEQDWSRAQHRLAIIGLDRLLAVERVAVERRKP